MVLDHPPSRRKLGGKVGPHAVDRDAQRSFEIPDIIMGYVAFVRAKIGIQEAHLHRPAFPALDRDQRGGKTVLTTAD